VLSAVSVVTKSLSARLGLPFHAFSTRTPRPNLPSEGIGDQERVKKRHFDPAAVNLLICENVRRYKLAIEAEKLRTPASQRQFGEPRASVQEIYEDTRLEAIEKFLEHGSVSLHALVAVEFQPVLFEAVRLANGPPQPPFVATGNVLIDTINAPFCALSYVEDRCQELGVGKKIIDSAESYLSRCDFAGLWWQRGQHYRLLDAPTMFVLMWDEVTRRSRDIAMAAGLSLQQ